MYFMQNLDLHFFVQVVNEHCMHELGWEHVI